MKLNVIFYVLVVFSLVVSACGKFSSSGQTSNNNNNVNTGEVQLLYSLKYYRGGWLTGLNMPQFSHNLNINFLTEGGPTVSGVATASNCQLSNQILSLQDQTILINLLSTLQLRIAPNGPTLADAGIETVELGLGNGTTRKYYLMASTAPAGSTVADNPQQLIDLLRSIYSRLPSVCQ